MTTQTVNIDLPEDIYQRFAGMAAVTQRPLEDVIYQSIRGNLPPLQDDIPPEQRGLVADLQLLDDEALWVVAREPLPARQCCNEFKGPRYDAVDPRDGQATSLFHPRKQRWGEHFAWEDDGVTVRGLTPSGRATIDLLRFNNDWIVQARRIWILVGLQPPLD